MGNVVGVAVGKEGKSVDFSVVLDASEGAGPCNKIDVSWVKRSVCNHSHSRNHLRHLVEQKFSHPCAG